jgi:membrane protein YqaA with SNARE-associated domain
MKESAPAVEKKLSWYRRLYLRVEALSTTRYALAALLIVSVIDGSVFPIPPFALLVPMVLAHPRRWWWLCLLGTLASIGGGLLGYWLGAVFQSQVADALGIDLDVRLDLPRLGIQSTLGQLLGDNFWVLVLLCSVLPTPFKVVAIGSGLVSVPLGRFVLAAVIGRTARFFLIGGVMAFVGPRGRKWLRI